jgi:hypothetical protein
MNQKTLDFIFKTLLFWLIVAVSIFFAVFYAVNGNWTESAKFAIFLGVFSAFEIYKKRSKAK